MVIENSIEDIKQNIDKWITITDTILKENRDIAEFQLILDVKQLNSMLKQIQTKIRTMREEHGFKTKNNLRQQNATNECNNTKQQCKRKKNVARNMSITKIRHKSPANKTGRNRNKNRILRGE
jgi:hypothetical protein